jgi:catechol 2,3-dioxygenase-like lactoylglutathione lyase family enzyme
MNHTPKFGFSVEYVTDIEAAKRFYVEVFGLEVARSSPVYVQFDHFALASDESLSGSREPEVYWLVDDTEAAFSALSPQAEVSVPLKQMPFGKVFGIKDPAGQPLYLLEFAQNRPSQLMK